MVTVGVVVTLVLVVFIVLAVLLLAFCLCKKYKLQRTTGSFLPVPNGEHTAKSETADQIQNSKSASPVSLNEETGQGIKYSKASPSPEPASESQTKESIVAKVNS